MRYYHRDRTEQKRKMDKKEQITKDLLKMMKSKRAEIDPEILEKARLAAVQHQQDRAHEQAGTVPYDRKAAAAVISHFIDNSKNPDHLMKMIEAELKK